MGTLFSTLDIARSGLQAAQVQMDVAGHNIANVNKEGYSRQRVILGNLEPVARTYGQIGRGVAVEDVERVRETFLDTAYRAQVAGLGSAEVQASYFNRVEDLFQEPGENGFGNRLSAFFEALEDFSSNVEETPVRMSVLTEAQSLASSLNLVARQIQALRTNTNEEVRSRAPEINSLGRRVAELNLNISRAEVNGTTASDLRDERDLLLDQLAHQVNITYRENTSGQVSVLIGGDSFIEGTVVRELAAVRNPALDPERPDLIEVQFADTGRPVSIQGGELHGALSIRDAVLPELMERLDAIAAALIQDINRVQSTGNGLDNLTGTVEGTNAVADPAAALGSAGLPFAVSPGSFDVVVYDASGAQTSTSITLTSATTLESLAAGLNAAAHVTASVTADNRLKVGANSGYTFTLANDTSGALAALGVNGFFTGHDAASIGVSQYILDNPRLLASGYSLDPAETGDNRAALDMAGLRTRAVLENGSATLGDYYETAIVRLGVDTRANNEALNVQQTFIESFERRRQEVSGVSLDEEVAFMIQYQRAFEASARVITVVDRMLESLFAAVA